MGSAPFENLTATRPAPHAQAPRCSYKHFPQNQTLEQVISSYASVGAAVSRAAPTRTRIFQHGVCCTHHGRRCTIERAPPTSSGHQRSWLVSLRSGIGSRGPVPCLTRRIVLRAESLDDALCCERPIRCRPISGSVRREHDIGAHATRTALLSQQRLILRHGDPGAGTPVRESNLERRTAPARSRDIGVPEFEPGAVRGLDEVDLRPVQVLVAQGIDIERNAMRLKAFVHFRR